MFPILAWAVFFSYYNCYGYFVLSQSSSVCMITCCNLLCLKLKFPAFATEALTLYLMSKVYDSWQTANGSSEH